MCDYAPKVSTAMKALAGRGEPFDMLQVRDMTRHLVGPAYDVRFLECKYEALASFERGTLPGWILTTKVIELETDELAVDSDGKHQFDESGALLHTVTKKSVFVFRPVTVVSS